MDFLQKLEKVFLSEQTSGLNALYVKIDDLKERRGLLANGEKAAPIDDAELVELKNQVRILSPEEKAELAEDRKHEILSFIIHRFSEEWSRGTKPDQFGTYERTLRTSEESRDFLNKRVEHYQDVRNEMNEMGLELPQTSSDQKDFETLKGTFLPILHGWTEEEIIKASFPYIRSRVRQFTTTQQPEEDAMAQAHIGVLEGLAHDKGRSPFGVWVWKWISRSVRRGALESGIIKKSERYGEFRSKVKSLDMPTSTGGEGEATTLGAMVKDPEDLFELMQNKEWWKNLIDESGVTSLEKTLLDRFLGLGVEKTSLENLMQDGTASISIQGKTKDIPIKQFRMVDFELIEKQKVPIWAAVVGTIKGEDGKIEKIKMYEEDLGVYEVPVSEYQKYPKITKHKLSEVISNALLKMRSYLKTSPETWEQAHELLGVKQLAHGGVVVKPAATEDGSTTIMKDSRRNWDPNVLSKMGLVAFFQTGLNAQSIKSKKGKIAGNSKDTIKFATPLANPVSKNDEYIIINKAKKDVTKETEKWTFASSGDENHLMDGNRNWPEVSGYQVRFFSGKLKSEIRTISDNTKSLIRWDEPLPVAVDNAQYAIVDEDGNIITKTIAKQFAESVVRLLANKLLVEFYKNKVAVSILHEVIEYNSVFVEFEES